MLKIVGPVEIGDERPLPDLSRFEQIGSVISVVSESPPESDTAMSQTTLFHAVPSLCMG